MNRQSQHSHRDDLVGEHPFGDTGQLILLIIFLVVWIIDSFVLRLSTFFAQYVSLFLRVPLGIVFLFIAGYLAQQGMKVVFGEERTEPQIIEKDVFRRVRHPVYLGCILFYIALVIFTLSILAAVICTTIIVFYHYIAKYEEKLLLSRFGTEYEQYMNSVPMWIPRIKP
jgi:protein-S-isoprenylcysteine O-methyltransferase Ste14